MPEEAPDVTVVTPATRRPEIVLEAVRSALAQAGPSVEVIVVDDGAPGIGAALEGLGDRRVQRAALEKPSGGNPALPRNAGLARARGRAVIFLDDDDVLVPGALRKLLAALEEVPGRVAAFGAVEPFGPDPQTLLHEVAYFVEAAHRARRTVDSDGLARRLLFGPAFVVSSCCLYRRDRLEQVGGFDPRIPIAGPIDLFLRAAYGRAWAFVDEKLVRYRVDPSSLIHDGRNSARLWADYVEMGRAFRAEHGFFRYTALRLRARALGR